MFVMQHSSVPFNGSLQNHIEAWQLKFDFQDFQDFFYQKVDFESLGIRAK